MVYVNSSGEVVQKRDQGVLGIVSGYLKNGVQFIVGFFQSLFAPFGTTNGQPRTRSTQSNDGLRRDTLERMGTLSSNREGKFIGNSLVFF
jgi:hypothetical protein